MESVMKKKLKHKWIKNSYDNKPDIFAYEMGYHNGPKCERCFKEFCHHCNPECYEEECKGKIITCLSWPHHPQQ